jgi:hypothetical protein
LHALCNRLLETVRFALEWVVGFADGVRFLPRPRHVPFVVLHHMCELVSQYTIGVGMSGGGRSVGEVDVLTNRERVRLQLLCDAIDCDAGVQPHMIQRAIERMLEADALLGRQRPALARRNPDIAAPAALVSAGGQQALHVAVPPLLLKTEEHPSARSTVGTREHAAGDGRVRPDDYV